MKMAMLCPARNKFWQLDSRRNNREKRSTGNEESERDRENLLIYVINLDFTYQMALVDLGNDTTAW